MAKRKSKRAAVPTLADWRAVDRAVMGLAGLEAQAARLKNEAEEKIRFIREDAAARSAEALEGADAIRDAIEKFADVHVVDFGKARSRGLPHGRIGWRRIPRVKFLVTAPTLVAALERRGLVGAIIVKKSPNKEVLAGLPARVLADVGARLVVVEKFYVEPAEETA